MYMYHAKEQFKMLDVFSRTFVAVSEIIFGYNVGSPLKVHYWRFENLPQSLSSYENMLNLKISH